MSTKHKTPEQIEEAKLKRRAYMREYKHNSYDREREKVLNYQRYHHFIKTHPEVNKADLDQFPVMKGEFIKLLCQIRKIQTSHPEELQNFLNTWKVF